MFAVIFAATSGADGKVAALTVSKVIDPSTGTTNAVAQPIPPEFVVAARRHLQGKTYPASDHFSTYLFFDPKQPTRADLEPPPHR